MTPGSNPVPFRSEDKFDSSCYFLFLFEEYIGWGGSGGYGAGI